ncbi:SGNH/GDSL hydrolase family protein [Tistrella bauzanensis]|uniref:SGNH/GDSL hydrolase family protein n=1 Tax=Tistrella TaxID=171436 RepID=UPI0031F63D2D
MTIETAAEIWRDLDPSTGGTWEPPKSWIRAWGGALEAVMFEVATTGAVPWVLSAADLPDSPVPDAPAARQVIADDTPSNNGLWYVGDVEGSPGWIHAASPTADIAADIVAIQTDITDINGRVTVLDADYIGSRRPLMVDETTGRVALSLEGSDIVASIGCGVGIGLDGYRVRQAPDTWPPYVEYSGPAGAERITRMVTRGGAVLTFPAASTASGSAAGHPLATDGRSLYAYRAVGSAVAAEIGGVLRVLITGDSQVERYQVPQAISTALQGTYTLSGSGWISVNNASSAIHYPLDGVTYARTGWTIDDMGDAQSWSLDGFAAISTASTATMSIGGARCTEVWVYYRDLDGTFQVSVDGGASIETVGGGTGDISRVVVSGLAAGAHDIAITTAGNVGTVVIGGIMARSTSAGVEISKAGNGGSTAADFEALSVTSKTWIGQINPHLVMINLATNDATASVQTVDFAASLSAYISSIRSVCPDAGIIIFAPPKNSENTAPSIYDFRDAIFGVAAASGCEVLNVCDAWSTYGAMSSLGCWYDSRHQSETGGAAIASQLMTHLLSLR